MKTGGFICMLLLSVGMQFKSGAYVGDFAAHPDEPAHVVSSLLIRDYLAGHLFENPLRYAENYYVHFPKVAIGHWPPLFHVTEGIWMLLFGRSKASLLVLLAFLAAALVAAVLGLVLPDCGSLAGIAAAAILATTPFLQNSVSSVMPDLLLSLLGFGAMVAWGDYLESGQMRAALFAVILVFAASATNARGLAVGLALLLAGSFAAGTAAARWRFRYFTAIVLLLVCLPGFARGPTRVTPGIIIANFARFGVSLAHQVTWPAAVLVFGGAFVIWRNRKEDPRSLAILCLIAGTWIFHSLLNFPFEDRYLASALPATMVLFAAGWRFFSQRDIKLVTAAFSLAACAIIGWNLAHFAPKNDLGYHQLVNGSSDAARSSRISLVAGDGLEEGSYIAEMDLADTHLQHIVLRGSKVLASSTWAGSQYRARFGSAAEVADYLDKFGVTLVIVQDNGLPHIARLLAAVGNSPGSWRESPDETMLKKARIFQRSGPPPGVPSVIQMRDAFGRDFHLYE